MPTLLDPEIPLPRQARSLETSDAIVGAALALMARHPDADHGVAEIAAEAGISVGGFYARFRSKQALLRALYQHVVDDCRDALDQAMDTAAADIPAIVRAYVTGMVRKFAEHRVPIRSIRARAHAGDATLARQVAAFNQHVHGRVRDALLARRREIGHDDPALAIEFGLFQASAGAREAILSDALGTYRVRLGTERVIDELTDAWLRYMRVTTTRSRERR